MAWKALLEETKDQRLTTRRCSVYAAGMSLMAILRLANQHNQINSLKKQTTFMEHVQKSRELLFLEFGGGKQDDGEYMPALPHYNHHDYIKLKQLCLAHIVGPSVVSSCRHLISSMMYKINWGGPEVNAWRLKLLTSTVCTCQQLPQTDYWHWSYPTYVAWQKKLNNVWGLSPVPKTGTLSVMPQTTIDLAVAKVQ